MVHLVLFCILYDAQMLFLMNIPAQSPCTCKSQPRASPRAPPSASSTPSSTTSLHAILYTIFHTEPPRHPPHRSSTPSSTPSSTRISTPSSTPSLHAHLHAILHAILHTEPPRASPRHPPRAQSIRARVTRVTVQSVRSLQSADPLLASVRSRACAYGPATPRLRVRARTCSPLRGTRTLPL